MDRSTAQEVVAKKVRYHPITRGARNGNLYIVAAELNNYGVAFADALHVCLQYVETGGDDPFTAEEIQRVVGSAYKGTAHGIKTWVPDAQYRRPAPRLPRPWKLSEDHRARLVAKLVADLDAAAPPPPAPAPPAPPPAPPPPPPAPPPPAPPPPAPPPPAADIPGHVHAMVCELARDGAGWQAYTLALELYVRTGINLTGQEVARLLAKNGEGGSAPRAYPLSPPRHGRMAMPQK